MVTGLALTVGFFAASEVEAQSTSIGPGIAGQVHALAVDPVDSNVIYAGGDVCGAYVSRDFGASWELWNDGLGGRDLTRSYYVDDLLVLDESVGVHPARYGVYAATHGGIYRRPKSGGSWVLETDTGADCRYAYEDNGSNPFVGSKGAPIPFSCFAYDPVDSVLYAGTGHGRYEWTSGGDRGYPQVPLDRIVLCEGQQYSVWSLDCSSAGLGARWVPILETANRGRVTQMAVSHHDGISEVVFACSSGLLSFGDPTKGTGPANLWQMRTQGFDTLGWSSRHWGVGAGNGGMIYCLAVGDSVNVGGVEVWRSPGVYSTDLAEPSGDWEIVGPLDAVVPPTSMTWNQICNHVTSDGKHLQLFTLTVRPGLGRLPGSTGAPLDELFVGEWTATLRSGYYRFGEFASGDTTAVGWTQPLHLTGGWNSFAYGSHDWFTNTTRAIEAGWCSNYAIFSTTPLAYSATNANRLVAANYHMPVVSDDGGHTWSQVYTTYDGEIGHSTGLNLMVPVSAASAANGDVYMGSRDFGVFKTTQPLADDFHWLNWWHTGNPNAWNLAIREVGDGQEVYVVRDAPAVANATWTLDPLGRPAQAIGMLSPEPSDHRDVDEWRYISDGITDIYDGFPGYVPPEGTGANMKVFNRYRITGLAFQGSDTLFASCEFQSGRSGDGPATATCKVLRAVWSGGQWLWEELGIFPDDPLQGEIGRRQRFGSIAAIKRTSTVIVAAKEGYNGRGGLYAFNSAIPTNATSGLRILLDGDSTTDEFLRYAARNVSALQVDRLERYLYVGTQGLHAWDTTAKGWGTVLRCALPVAAQAPAAWTILANSETPTFGYERPRFLYDGFAGDSDLDLNRRLTVINDIAVDPHNPERLWVAMGQVALAEPNGVWIHGANGSWDQVIGGFGDGLPGMPGNVVELNRLYPDRLYAGIGGQEFFRTQTTISSHPDIAASASHPLLAAISDSVQVLTVHIAADTTLVAVEADLGGLGLPGEELILLDDGEGEDLAEGDGVFTSTRFPALLTAGTGYSVRVFAQDATGGYDEREVAVEAVASKAHFEDLTEFTGDLADILTEQPYSAVYFKSRPGDPESEDIMIVTFDNAGSLGVGQQPQILQMSDPAQNGAPQFARKTDDWIGLSGLPRGARGVSYADFDNDGDNDFFLCNPATGGRLYRSWFAQDMQVFTNATDTIFGADAAHLSQAIAASWGDYNADGYADLFVAGTNYFNSVQALATDGFGSGGSSGITYSGWIFRNRGGDVFTKTLWGSQSQNNVLLGACWADLDNDGDLDQISAKYIGGPIQVLENTGFYYPLGDNLMGVTGWGIPLSDPDWVYGANSVTVFDYDHDVYPDLVVTFATHDGNPKVKILRNNFGTGSRVFTPIDVASGTEWNGATVADFDLDGQDDILLHPRASGVAPGLYLADGYGTSATYRDLGFTAGLRGGSTGGAVAVDFDQERNIDLYLGRGEGNDRGALYRNAGQAAASNAWLEVRPRTVSGGYGSLVGTKVIVEAQGRRWQKTVEGGGGRGGQGANQLLFGLGDVTGDVSVTVRFPSGEVDGPVTVSPNGAAFEVWEHQAVVLLTPPPKQNLTYDYEFGPGTADWIFRWRTDARRGDPARDRVEIWNYSNYDADGDCGVGIAPGQIRMLAPGDPEVEHLVYLIGDKWHHELRWLALPCGNNCQYKFRVTSGLGGQNQISNWVNMSTSTFCVAEPQDPGDPNQQ